VGKVRRGGFVFITWKGAASRRVRELIEALETEGAL
jgi:hypothetical protein